jgi:phosphatidate phosphatase APP1
MSIIRRMPLAVLYEIRRIGSRLRFLTRKGLGRIRSVRVVAYRGFGNERVFEMQGRVIEDRAILPAHREHTKRQNFVAVLRRFTAATIPDAVVRATYNGQSVEVATDDEGYFDVRIAHGYASTFDPWREVKLDLVTGGIKGQRPASTIGEVLIPPIDSETGIISDIDDTVIETGAANILRMIRITFLNNAHTRLPFEGVAAFYRALERGPTRTCHNPIFYVSSGPWNLYDMISDFFAVQSIPVGPIFLQDFGVDREKFIKVAHRAHKLEQIERIMRVYPRMRFVLIGDSGQHDPEIYEQVVIDLPGRVAAIYIREVTSGRRSAEVEQIRKRLEAKGIPMILSPDTEAAAEHAAAIGLISPETLADIRAEKAKDQHAPNDLQQLLTDL